MTLRPLDIASRTDRGATAVIVAASLFLLMGMTAVAVDLGAGFNERRQDQSAADFAALAAGVELLMGNGETDAVDAAKEHVDENLGRTLSAQAWAECQDPDSLGPTPQTVNNGLHPTHPCISFGDTGGLLAFDRIRVRIPTQETGTTFGRVLGVTELRTSAAAEVSMEPLLGQGAFPASVYNGTGAGEAVCIKTGTGSAAHESCGDPTTGNFGNFQPYFYKEVHPALPNSRCTSGNQPAPLSYVMAKGMDHALGRAPGVGQGQRVNGSDCPQEAGPINPDRVNSGSGYSNQDVTRGLLTGGTFDSTPYPGRFAVNPWGGTYGNATIFGVPIDNRPLWTFIVPSQASAADAQIGGDNCSNAAAGPSSVTDPDDPAFQEAWDALTACLQGYESSGVNLASGLFHEALYDSNRLTVVPEYWQSNPIGNNACCYDIKDLKPVYLNSLWTQHGPGWTCDGAIHSVPGDHCRHDPGRVGIVDHNAAGQQRIDSANAIVLSCEMLPGPPGEAEDRCKKIETINGDTITVFTNIFLVK